MKTILMVLMAALSPLSCAFADSADARTSAEVTAPQMLEGKRFTVEVNTVATEDA